MLWHLHTARLRLYPLPTAGIQALRDNSKRLAALLGILTADAQVPPPLARHWQKALDVWEREVAAHSREYKWFTHWSIVARAQQCQVGGLGFAGRPSADGQIFLNYWIDQRFQNCGFMTEALTALTRWAFRHESLRQINATVGLDNKPSARILTKLGFSPKGLRKGERIWSLARRAYTAG